MHDVTALIANSDKLTAATRRFETVVVCPLVQSFSLLPITEDFAKELSVYASQMKAPLTKPITELSDELHATCYFGGRGGQNALVWDKGSLRFSPTTQRYDQVWPNTPISQALRMIGVLAGEGMDEFDTVGLGKHRHTHRWAESVK